MIVDLCKPLNPGEYPTVRIILSAPEAKEMVAHFDDNGELWSAIEAALARWNGKRDGQ